MILDTNGLSALADGESTLEPILREAAEVALPVIVLADFDMAFANRATANGTSNG